ncbi:Hsp20/alpha crystallin family protein [Haloterrigena sp. SYSU A558-1]|uniref:Hsp20/alpha crystallin family protein n=1 Tax=Haloterrigena gelatinilytica TaxID=2741724 RepID=A0A8J8KE02_9EURY|nr:Hsp20/alpha crystallin family protein [Haloterrigena gelatinilytica]NUB89517.1 Hsp20/alpha crystallin family protein [Haloterrigena gelatinilytica]NUC74652.1 Hsp20/alpha crystallin family protein [Haloterrigena gelatinilytica]
MTSFDEMNRMFREMDRAFDQLRTTWMREFASPGFGGTLESGHAGFESDRYAPETDRRTLGSDGSSLESGRPVSGSQWPVFGGFGSQTGAAMGDAATLEDEGDAYVFVMDLPGFEKTDIDLGYADGRLTIDARTDVESGTDTAQSVRSRRVGRHVPVPKEIVADEITATYHNGVLEVRLPIAEDGDDGHRIELE